MQSVMSMAELKYAYAIADRLGVKLTLQPMAEQCLESRRYEDWTVQTLNDLASHFNKMVQRLEGQRARASNPRV